MLQMFGVYVDFSSGHMCSGNGYIMVCCEYVAFSFCFADRDEEEMNKREDRREGNKHCKERASKDKVINTFLNNCIETLLEVSSLQLSCIFILRPVFPSENSC